MEKSTIFSWLRAMSGGTLTLSQVQAGDKVIDSLGINTFADLIGYQEPSKSTSGQYDISEDGYQLIREFEGLRLSAYKDSAGIWTIGYGTIKYPNGTRVRQGDTITKQQAEEYLKTDTLWVDSALDRYITVKYTQRQHDALSSFIYNVGETAFKTSTLLKYLNKGDFTEAANQLTRFVNAGGKKIPGLVTRRQKEKMLFLK